MTAELVALFGDLDLDRLGVVRPRKFIFLCGGAIPSSPRAKPANLRDYLCRTRPLSRFFNIVLAEEAIDLYLSSHYSDLLEFEEDLAQLSALVLVITESAGSLSELGSFASLPAIAPSLKIIVSENHARARSFVRHGPIRRIERRARTDLAVYDWKSHKKTGALNVNSAKRHYSSIKKFVKSAYDAVPFRASFSQSGDAAKLFYIIYWTVYLYIAVTPVRLYDTIRTLGFAYTDQEIRNKLYCMQLAKWIDVIQYGGADYFYVNGQEDIFDYSFAAHAVDRNSIRRKQSVARSLRAVEPLERAVHDRAMTARAVLR